MTFKELIHRHHWLSIEAELLRLYPNQAPQVEAYEKVHEQLLSLAPEESDIVIRLTDIIDDDGDYVAVDGYYADGRVDEQSLNDALGLGFTPWEEWLGMPVDSKAFEEFTELEIITHCLYELTFYGFDQETIQAEIDNLKKTIDEYDNMTLEEKKQNTKSLEDFLKELDLEGGEDE